MNVLCILTQPSILFTPPALGLELGRVSRLHSRDIGSGMAFELHSAGGERLKIEQFWDLIECY